MRTIPAREIKRRGISTVDEALKCGPIHVIKNDELRYVILTEDHYRELMDEVAEAELARVRESLEDVKAGRVRRVTVEELTQQLGANDLDGD